MSARPAVFLDRDGTLVRDLAWGAEPGELELLPGVLPALRALRAAGYALVVVSNQAGVARGLFDLAEARRSGAHLAAILAAAGASLDGYYFSPYHEREGRMPAFSRASEARKPGAGMLRAAAADLALDLGRSWLIGDHLSDLAAGLAAGGRAILVDIGQLAWPTAEVIPALLRDPRTLVARNLPHAASLILASLLPSPSRFGEGVGRGWGRGRPRPPTPDPRPPRPAPGPPRARRALPLAERAMAGAGGGRRAAAGGRRTPIILRGPSMRRRSA
ncbi:MAG: HAD-IIIA family hydrolase [Ardenticatenia bacterium]|nr:HAD-IIIA family hydrolase [Ardenticatenia bacterium]